MVVRACTSVKTECLHCVTGYVVRVCRSLCVSNHPEAVVNEPLVSLVFSVIHAPSIALMSVLRCVIVFLILTLDVLCSLF